MKLARTLVGWVGALLMAGGYFASVAAALGGDTTAYSRALDSSAVPLLSLGLLLAAVCLAFLPARQEGDGKP